MKNSAVYPGSFDPITKGHIEIIERAVSIFGELRVAVLNNPAKNPWFSVQERVEMIKEIFKNDSRIIVESFSGLLVDYMLKNNSNIIIRGLRAVSDYEYELQLSLTNTMLSQNRVETIFLPASRENLYLSSSMVKDIALYGGDIDELVDGYVKECIKNKVNALRRY